MVSKLNLETAEPTKIKSESPPLPDILDSQVSERPKSTVSEKEAVSLPPSATAPPKMVEPPPVAARAPLPPRDLGKGGAQHQAIQQRLKQAAEELGFRGVIEHAVLEGAGSVDLWLERGREIIACEISISTTIDHEVGNVSKCLKAGCRNVAVICLDNERLRKIEAGVVGSLGAERGVFVRYFQPDQFLVHLKGLPPEIPKETTTVRRGYKIKRVITKLSTEQEKEKEAAAIRMIADSMRKG